MLVCTLRRKIIPCKFLFARELMVLPGILLIFSDFWSSKSGDIIEPRLKPQWWINCKPLAEEAIKVGSPPIDHALSTNSFSCSAQERVN